MKLSMMTVKPKVTNKELNGVTLKRAKHPVHGHAEDKKTWRHYDQGDQWVYPKTAGQLVGQVSAQKRQGKVGQIDLAQHAPRQAQTQSKQAIEATDKKPGQQRLSEQLKAGKLHSSQGYQGSKCFTPGLADARGQITTHSPF